MHIRCRYHADRRLGCSLGGRAANFDRSMTGMGNSSHMFGAPATRVRFLASEASARCFEESATQYCGCQRLCSPRRQLAPSRGPTYAGAHRLRLRSRRVATETSSGFVSFSSARYADIRRTRAALRCPSGRRRRVPRPG